MGMFAVGLFTGTFLFKAIEFVLIIAVAVAGVLVGKMLRTRKDNKNVRKETDNE